MVRAHRREARTTCSLSLCSRYADDVLLLGRRGKAKGGVSTVYGGVEWLTDESMFVGGVEGGIL